MSNWKPITETDPAEGMAVMTRIDDERGQRNEATLRRRGSLWFYPDDSMYVYYRPTHYVEVPDADRCPRCGDGMTLHPSGNFKECLRCHQEDMRAISEMIRARGHIEYDADGKPRAIVLGSSLVKPRG